MLVLLMSAIISFLLGFYFCLKEGEGFEQFANQVVLGFPLLILGSILLIVYFVFYVKRKM
ncbi:hypothetical protein SAMN03159341_13121 [Paenibacillus sp. 1_12]|nr:hypothetical protein SAMN03159341_13121 [Paenibacillus sp. 1_12]